MAPAGGRVARAVLENGLVVLAAEARAVPVVTAALSVEAGSRFDPDDMSGLAALVASLIVEGSHDLAPEQVALRVDSLGASAESGAGYETASLTFTGLSQDWRQALGMMLDLARAPRFEPSSIEEAVRHQLAEIADDEDDPYSIARRELFHMLFPGHPRGNPVTGYVGTVRLLCRDDLVEFHRARYGPRGAMLAIAGDVALDDALATAERAFAPWEPREAPAFVIDPPRRAAAPRRRLLDVERKQVHLCLGNLGIARSDPDYLAAKVLDVILGDSAGFGSRLATRLRENEGLAYVVESDTTGTAGRDPGVFWAYTATSAANAKAALAGILAELEAVRSAPPSREEISSAIDYLRGRRSIECETSEALAARLIALERFGLGLDYDDAYHRLVGAVTPDDVLRVARRVIDLDGYSLVAVGPAVSTLLS